MRKEYNVEQRSTKWHELRAKSVGGSDVSALFGINRYSTPTDVWQFKRGLTPFYNDLAEMNDDVQRGIVLEDVAFGLAAAHQGVGQLPQQPPGWPGGEARRRR